MSGDCLIVEMPGIQGPPGPGIVITANPLTDGATVEWDSALGKLGTVTLGGNRTLALPQTMAPGAYTLLVTQDSTGSRTLGYATGYFFTGGVAPALSDAPGATDLLEFFCDGARMLLTRTILDYLPPAPANAFTTESGAPYVTESGDYYVTES